MIVVSCSSTRSQAADFPNVFTNFLRINVYATDEFDAGLLQEYLDAGLTDGAEAKLDDPNWVHGLPPAVSLLARTKTLAAWIAPHNLATLFV